MYSYILCFDSEYKILNICMHICMCGRGSSGYACVYVCFVSVHVYVCIYGHDVCAYACMYITMYIRM